MLRMKPTLNLRQIESFCSVVRTGTVVAAARHMNVTQPVVSRAIGLLEARIGYKLFERRGRRLEPTPEGRALYREAESIYGSLDRLAQVAQDIRFQRAGELRVASLPSLSQSLLPRAAARFLSARPDVSMFVQSLPSRQVADLVATHQFDVGLIELPMARPGIAIEPLPPAKSVAVTPAAHPLARRKRISRRGPRRRAHGAALAAQLPPLPDRRCFRKAGHCTAGSDGDAALDHRLRVRGGWRWGHAGFSSGGRVVLQFCRCRRAAPKGRTDLALGHHLPAGPSWKHAQAVVEQLRKEISRIANN